MYAQVYKEPALSIPESYGGTALLGEKEEREFIPEPTEDTAETGAFCDTGRQSPILNQAKGWLSGVGLHLPKIGIEEILIIAVAAFLFFSDEKDITTAILLLALLFID
jgi:hypothetical protein